MEIFTSIGNWISEREALLSGVVAIVALLSVLVSALSLVHRRLSKERATRSAMEESSQGSTISLKSLSAPAPYPIQFAQSDGLRIAYAVQGNGPHEFLMAPGMISHLNILSHFPPIRDTFDAISKFATVACFDKRGQGLSDPSLAVPDLNERVHDIEAVMDAAGMDQAILYGISEGGAMCLKFAHDYPDRVKGLVLLGTTARWLQSDDFPMGLSERTLDVIPEAWGKGTLRDIFFPSITRELMDDKTYIGFEQLISSRQSMRHLVEFMKGTDVRPLLAEIQCPVLVIHFGGDLAVPIRMGRAVAEALPNAEFLEVHGIDHADLSQSPEGIERVRQFADSL